MVGSTREEENRLRINDAIVRLRDEMKPLVVEVIGEAIRRKRWSLDRMPDIWKKNIQSLEDVQNSDDPELFIVIVRNAWDNEFSPLLSPQGVSLDLVFKVINIRNYLIHYNRKLNLRNQVQVEASIGAFDHLRTAVEKVNDNRRTMRDTAARGQPQATPAQPTAQRTHTRMTEVKYRPQGRNRPLNMLPDKVRNILTRPRGFEKGMFNIADIRSLEIVRTPDGMSKRIGYATTRTILPYFLRRGKMMGYDDILSVQSVEKPDGTYIQIKHYSGPDRMERYQGKVKEMWKRPVVKTVAIATAAATVYNMVVLIIKAIIP